MDQWNGPAPAANLTSRKRRRDTDPGLSLAAAEAARWTSSDECVPSQSLRDWGVPHSVAAAYLHLGKVQELFPWQYECLKHNKMEAFLRGGNLCYWYVNCLM
jgi:hypothetical protein